MMSLPSSLKKERSDPFTSLLPMSPYRKSIHSFAYLGHTIQRPPAGTTTTQESRQQVLYFDACPGICTTILQGYKCWTHSWHCHLCNMRHIWWKHWRPCQSKHDESLRDWACLLFGWILKTDCNKRHLKVMQTGVNHWEQQVVEKFGKTWNNSNNFWKQRKCTSHPVTDSWLVLSLHHISCLWEEFTPLMFWGSDNGSYLQLSTLCIHVF